MPVRSSSRWVRLGMLAAAASLLIAIVGGVAIVASIIGTFAVKSAAGNVERALYQGLILSGVIAAAAFYPVTKWVMDGVTGGDNPSVGDLYLCSIVGIAAFWIGGGHETWLEAGFPRRHQSTKIYNFVPSFPGLTKDC